ncbi:rhodanese-related sulfurtransferase [Krasilnikovia cinnamomea]|uniref:Rhodanese-related sulfurtransferase n=1 Tax=Krasilnikovia cinnamomea TaxID=349313 RepID=A0A4Q7ZSR4_9ACTN|nr:rhodanese-like domain-containing protein [Krasilnikovia cinnamomea]RZU53555.1 rhodanese-related sulfurtransferase [Krasilnikovia cinnamomea]
MNPRPRVAATLAMSASLLAATAGCSDTTPAIVDQAAARTLIDVRTPAEFAGGHLRNALNLDVQSPAFASEVGRFDRSGKYLVYCRSGHRAEAAITSMRDLGFTDLVNGGGYDQLKSAGVPTA